METELEHCQWGGYMESWIDESSSCRRSICGNCNRPSTVCLCSVLPETPIHTANTLIILQHPHQLHNPLSTVPILTKSLFNATVIVARRLRLGMSPLLDSIYHSHSSTKTVAYLFPPTKDHRSSTMPLSALRHSSRRIEVLIAFDGTWNHAREMVAASFDFLSKFAFRVSLECDERIEGNSIYDSELILRKEPYQGCVSTAEAVARVLSVIEPDGHGVETERQLLRVLGQMVKLQKGFLKPNPLHRPKLKKKKKKGNANDNKEAPLIGSGSRFINQTSTHALLSASTLIN